MKVFLRTRRHAAATTGLVLVLACLCGLALYPWAMRVWSLGRITFGAGESSAKNLEFTVQTKAMQRDLRLLDSQIKRVQESSPAARGAEIMAFLRKIAADHGLRVLAISSQGEKRHSGYLDYTVNLNLRGNFHSLGKWFEACCKEYPNSMVRNLSVTRQEFSYLKPKARIEIAFLSPLEAGK